MYIGYPVDIDELLRICKITYDCPYSIDSENPSESDKYILYQEELNERIELYLQKYNLKYHRFNGICVIGLDINNICKDICIDIDSFNKIIFELKSEIKNNVLQGGLDLSNIKIKLGFNSKPILVENPEPYFINFSHYHFQ